MLLDLDVRLARLEVHRTLLFPQGQLASNVGALMEALGQLLAMPLSDTRGCMRAAMQPPRAEHVLRRRVQAPV